MANTAKNLFGGRSVAVDAHRMLRSEFGELFLGVAMEGHVAGMADEFERHLLTGPPACGPGIA